MIFSLDATPLSVPMGGIRRYTECLARALAQEFGGDEFWLISDQKILNQNSDVRSSSNLHYKTLATRRWWSWGLPRALSDLNANLFHGTDFAVPYLPARPSVLTLHDLSPWKEGFTGSARVRRRTPLMLRAGIATMVITPSEAIRRTAIERFNLDPERVVAIPLAASECFHPFEGAPAERPYFLYAGSAEARKNVSRLIEAWREVRKAHEVDLILVGAFELPDEPGLRRQGRVIDEELRRLYSGAAAFVYPSLYEGFGLPVLEAMQCGALVITSKDPAIMEVTGSCGALHVDATDTGQLIRAMLHALNGDTASRREQGLACARQFSWLQTARRTREVYDAAIRVFTGS